MHCAEPVSAADQPQHCSGAGHVAGQATICGEPDQHCSAVWPPSCVTGGGWGVCAAVAQRELPYHWSSGFSQKQKMEVRHWGLGLLCSPQRMRRLGGYPPPKKAGQALCHRPPSPPHIQDNAPVSSLHRRNTLGFWGPLENPRPHGTTRPASGCLHTQGLPGCCPCRSWQLCRRRTSWIFGG